MNTIRIKLVAIIAFGIPLLAAALFGNAPVTGAAVTGDDAAATYKAKCAACHTAKAEKFYDPAMPEAEQVEAILKGKKGEKPPYMPAFEAKGITEDQAKELSAYMKGLRTPAN